MSFNTFRKNKILMKICEFIGSYTGEGKKINIFFDMVFYHCGFAVNSMFLFLLSPYEPRHVILNNVAFCQV